MGHRYKYLGEKKCPECQGDLYYSNLEDTKKLVCKNCNIIIKPEERITVKGYRV